MSGFRGTVQADIEGLCQHEGHSQLEIMEACVGLRAWTSGVEIMEAFAVSGDTAGLAEIVHVWILSIAGLAGMAQQSRDHAGLCRPGVGAVEQRSCVCVYSWLSRP
jgi:hypothetical protein